MDGHDTYEEFFDKLSLKEQENLLKKFIDEVIYFIIDHSSNKK
jgi:hypothetical protein